jgi:death on curing protein
MIIYLSKKRIIRINQSTIEIHGGNYMLPSNFLHESNLDYLLEAVQAEMFGEHLYPNITDKAAVYCYNIICNHIFTDGNKRTGLEAGLIFLELNNMRLCKDLPLMELQDFIIKIASGESSLEECRTWFADNSVPLK